MSAFAIRCIHGKATAWTGVAMPGDVLPRCESCSECAADAEDRVRDALIDNADRRAEDDR